MAEIYHLKANGDAHFAGIVSQNGEPVNDEDLVNKGFLSAQIGSISSGLNKEVFLTNGVWNVPDGVKEVWITACGGGGGGSSSSTVGKNGGATIIDGLVTLAGGGAGGTGIAGIGGIAGGSGGSSGMSYNDATSGSFPKKISSKFAYVKFGEGMGYPIGGMSLGFGGSLFTSQASVEGFSVLGNLPNPTVPTSKGSGVLMPSLGGGGAGSFSSGAQGAAGGGADAVYKKKYSIPSGVTEINVTIGTGGKNSNLDTPSNGADGIVIIEW